MVMTPEAKARRAQKDHDRYMAHREERCKQQQARYRANPDYYKQKARQWEQQQRERL